MLSSILKIAEVSKEEALRIHIPKPMGLQNDGAYAQKTSDDNFSWKAGIYM